MQKLMKVLSIIFIAAGLSVYACRVADHFFHVNSDISFIGREFASEGFIFVLIGMILAYQLKVIDLNNQLKAKSK
ncbi:MAG: hypothetical protein NTX25_02220 [Proteobacteria bacterium]|nr:hypothetical protein [Pseudomonadota bacterium]